MTHRQDLFDHLNKLVKINGFTLQMEIDSIESKTMHENPDAPPKWVNHRSVPNDRRKGFARNMASRIAARRAVSFEGRSHVQVKGEAGKDSTVPRSVRVGVVAQSTQDVLGQQMT